MSSEAERIRPSVVIALAGSGEGKAKKYEGCRIILHGDVYPAIYSQVFGPASRKDCERWVAKNCSKPGAATK